MMDIVCTHIYICIDIIIIHISVIYIYIYIYILVFLYIFLIFAAKSPDCLAQRPMLVGKVYHIS